MSTLLTLSRIRHFDWRSPFGKKAQELVHDSKEEEVYVFTMDLFSLKK
jgi:hypothetical protein